MTRKKRVAHLLEDDRGMATVEFAFVGSMFLVMIMGAFDVGHTLYVQSILQGTVQKAARDSALQTGSEASKQATLDAAVTTQVKRLNSAANVTFSRRFYRTFSKASAARYETFTDGNANGRCDSNEPYEDANNNNVWDADGGNSGQGGAQDVVVYTVNVSYARLFPMAGLVGASPTVNLKASTVLQNQPYGPQAEDSVVVARNCT